MESIDPANLADVNKGFNKPDEFGDVQERLSRRNILAITSFIFGLAHDTAGVDGRSSRFGGGRRGCRCSEPSCRCPPPRFTNDSKRLVA